MTPDYLSVSLAQVGVSALLVLSAVALLWWSRSGLEKTFLWGATRSFVQLWLVGYVLLWLFHQNSWWVYGLVVEFMICAGAYTAGKRQETFSWRVIVSLWLALHASILVVAAFLFYVVLRAHPLEAPNVFIPLMGMMIGNSASGAALAVNRLRGELKSRRGEIEAALALGASPSRAMEPYAALTLRNAMIPMMNSMMLMGIVQLPGILTGQLIAGAVPEEAVRYQIIVVYMLAGAVSLACQIAIFLEVRRMFTPRWALAIEE